MKTFQVHAWQLLSSCCCLVAQSCRTLCDPMDYSPSGSSVHETSQASTGVGCHFLLQGVFPTQGLNPSLLQVSRIVRGIFTAEPPGKPAEQLHSKNVFHVKHTTTTTTKSLQSCSTLCDPTDGSPSGSTILGILQARTLEWVAIPSSNAWKWKVKVKSLSHVWLLATPWTAAHQAPPSMGFSRQEYWSGVPLPSLMSSIHTFKI